MAGYRDELERLNFSAEEKEALTCRLLERRSGQEEKRPRFPYRGLVAIVAAASLLTGAVGAVSLAGVSPAFRELFGITSEEQAKNLGVIQMNQVFEDKNGSGATVDVYKRQVLGVSPDLSTSLPMKYRTTTLDSGTLYLGSDQFSVCGNYTLKEGRDISAFDVDRRSRVCVLGSYVADSLFQYADPIGETVYFGGEPFTCLLYTSRCV